MDLIPTAYAHEVYVLDQSTVGQAISQTSPNPFQAVPAQMFQFLTWGFVIGILAIAALKMSISPFFEKIFDPVLVKLKKYAPLCGRLTFGASLMASGYFHDFFGPELPVAHALSPALASSLSALLIAGGFLVMIGFMTRIVSAVASVVFIFTAYTYGWYMLTYVNYLGEAILFLILGGGKWSLDRAVPALARLERPFLRVVRILERYSFLILRVLFGTAVVFASFYAKFLHSNLALMTVNEYHLTDYFHFTPMFLVLGAFIVEALLGLCFALGLEVRLAALVFTFFLTLSILFFGEAVWPHLILFGINITLFAHGYDAYTLERALFQRRRRGEPVL